MTPSRSLSLLLILLNSVAWGFVPRVSTRAASRLWNAASAPDDEKTLRNAIASRNEKVDNEGQYAVVDGENLYKGIVFDEASQQGQPQVIAFVDDQDASSVNDQGATQSAVAALVTKMQRLVKPRAYPLFLAEKAAEIAEMTVSDLLHPYKHRHSYHASGDKTATKERIVILGSGWGAASFLKAIDTSLYDVTVISPRVSVMCLTLGLEWVMCTRLDSVLTCFSLWPTEPLCVYTHASGCLRWHG